MRLKRFFTSMLGFFVSYSAIIIIVSMAFEYLSSTILPNTELGLYDKQFWSGLLINANSSIIDFFVIGIAIHYIQKKKSDQITLMDQYRELEDYASHSSIELNLKKMGIIRRLQNAGKKIINIKRLALEGISVAEIKIESSDLTGLSLYDSRLTNCTFSKCNLRSLNLEKVKAKNLNLTNCEANNLRFNHGKFTGLFCNEANLSNSSFLGATLKSGIFKSCDFSGVNFEGSDLRSANIKSSYNIDVLELCKAKCLDYIVAEDSIIIEIKSTRGDVKFSR